ncbi:unnamed protein product, partial [Ectocarpus sp. 8 AP-2014]
HLSPKFPSSAFVHKPHKFHARLITCCPIRPSSKFFYQQPLPTKHALFPPSSPSVQGARASFFALSCRARSAYVCHECITTQPTVHRTALPDKPTHLLTRLLQVNKNAIMMM